MSSNLEVMYSNTHFYSIITLLPSFLKLSPNSLILSSVLFFSPLCILFLFISSAISNVETMEAVRDFILGGSKITANGDCSHEIKTLTPWRKSYDQPRQHIKRQRRYFANKGPSSQSYVFPVAMYECES